MQPNQSLLFVGGDLSGIQKFIYNISSKKAAVSLKGRSAYLVDYTESVCNRLLKLPLVDAGQRKETVYCSGGKFYLIVDDTPDIRSAIDAYADKVETDLWHQQQGQLGIAIAYLPFRFLDNEESKVEIEGEQGGIGLLWQEMTTLFTSKKNRKFSRVLLDMYESFFEVQPVGGDVHVCAITGIESAGCVPLEDGKDSLWVLPSVKQQVELGNKLRAKDDFKTFVEYADGTYLGVLRMDVDKLGARFVKGFDNLQSYNRFSTHLKQFFDTNVLALRQKEYYKDFLNIIYAGGDDLFAVGRWDRIIDFAADVRNQFMEHTEGENLSISGGIAIVGSMFPIAKAAEIAGEAEECAKHYNNGEKNAICFLGETIGWDTEFDEVRRLKDEFCYQVKANALSHAVLHQLMIYAEMATRGESLSYLWHATYYLTRQLEHYQPKQESVRAFIKKLRDEHLTKGVRQYQLLAVAARWAELVLRFE